MDPVKIDGVSKAMKVPDKLLAFATAINSGCVDEVDTGFGVGIEEGAGNGSAEP